MIQMKFYTVLAVLLAATCVVTTTTYAQAQLELEPPELIIGGPPTNFTADQQDRDIAIDPTDVLPANGTVTISTALATDMDINEFPPLGVSVIIQNDTITVTNQTVTIDYGDDSSSSSDGGNGDSDGGDDE